MAKTSKTKFRKKKMPKIEMSKCKMIERIEIFVFRMQKNHYRGLGQLVAGHLVAGQLRAGSWSHGHLVTRTFGRNALSMRNMKFEKNRILLFFLWKIKQAKSDVKRFG